MCAGQLHLNKGQINVSVKVVAMTERELLDSVVELARYRRWLVHHCRPALSKAGRYTTPIQGGKGFPDLILVRGRRVVVAELKSQKGKVAPEQTAWLGAFDKAGCDVYTWRPSDWLSGEIERVLA